MRYESIGEKYKVIVQGFLTGSLGAEEFARGYSDNFLGEPASSMNRPLFRILQDLFEDIEAYSPMWLPEDECAYRITEATLRREAADALAELDRFLVEHSDSHE